MNKVLVILLFLPCIVFGQPAETKDSLFQYYHRKAIGRDERIPLPVSAEERIALFQNRIFFCNKALEIYPDDTTTLYGKANAFSELQMHDSSLVLRKRIEPYLLRNGFDYLPGEDCYFLGDTVTANNYFASALIWHESNDVGCFDLRIWLLLVLGRKNEAQRLIAEMKDKKRQKSLSNLFSKTKVELLRGN